MAALGTALLERGMVLYPQQSFPQKRQDLSLLILNALRLGSKPSESLGFGVSSISIITLGG